MKEILISVSILTLAACGSQKEVVETNPLYQQQTAWAEQVTDSNGNTFQQTHNVRYRFHELMLADLPTPVMLEIKDETRQPLGQPDKRISSQTVTTWKITDTALVQLSQFTIPANRGDLVNENTNWYNTVYAEPGKHTITVVHSLATGEKVLQYALGLSKLTLPKTAVTRYIGFHPIGSALPISDQDKIPQDVAGILTYARPDGVLQRAVLRIRDSRLMDNIKINPPQIFLITERMGNEIRSQKMELWPPQGEDFNTVPDDFYIEINYGRVRELEPIRIHVLEDKLVLGPQPDERIILELLPLE